MIVLLDIHDVLHYGICFQVEGGLDLHFEQAKEALKHFRSKMAEKYVLPLVVQFNINTPQYVAILH